MSSRNAMYTATVPHYICIYDLTLDKGLVACDIKPINMINTTAQYRMSPLHRAPYQRLLYVVIVGH